MASHIATEEWQSFELRMRRRRAERMLARAKAALDAGSCDEARAALDEARRLCPTLTAIDDLEAEVAQAAERTARAPFAARARRALAIAAGLLVCAAAGTYGWRVAAVPTRSAASNSTTPAPPATVVPPVLPAPNTPAAPAIRIETEQVPPVVVSGADSDAAAPSAPAAIQQRPFESAALTPPASAPADTSAVPQPAGTAGPIPAQSPAPPDPAPADVGAIAALGTEAPLAAPTTATPAVDRGDQPAEPATGAAQPHAAPSIARAADPATPMSTPPSPKRTDEAALVRSTLDRYAEAYTHLDADAAKAVWPSVNRAALSRAFRGLNEQKIAFTDCSVDVRSSVARATCSGSATWEPKIGGGPRTDMRRWAFDLEKSGDDWVIRDARVQNR